MARRKKSYRSKGRRRSVSGVKGGAVMEVVAVAGGAVAAKFLAKILGPKVNNDKLLNGIILAGGMFLPRFMKSNFGKGIGAGMIAAGSVGLLSSMGVLQGIGADEYQMEFISGPDNINVLSDVGEDNDPAYDGVNGIGNDGLNVVSGMGEFPSEDELSYMNGLHQ